MKSLNLSFWKDRLFASAIHLSLSVLVAVMAALLVFFVWFPYPYREISGGRDLFLILIAVDVIMGPLITLAIFDSYKPARELRRDMFIVVALQLSALVYGLLTVMLARPVHLVFEYDRFRVVHAIDVPDELLEKVPADITAKPYFGPTLLGLREFHNEQEKMDMTVAALQGIQLGFRPDLWQPYEASQHSVLRIAKPLSALSQRFPDQTATVLPLLLSSGESIENLVYLPLVGRQSFWTIVLDARTAGVVGYVPVDSFQ